MPPKIGKVRVFVADGEEYVWEPDEITLAEGLMIEQTAERKFKVWMSGVANDDLLSMQVLVWFLRRKAGQQMDLGQVSFRIADMVVERIDDALDADAGDNAAGGEVDPEASAG